MPGLENSIHLEMLKIGHERHAEQSLYGLHWGDPDTVSNLRWFTSKYVTPYLDPNVDAVEIGPGGGRWTQMLVGFHRLYAVDYHEELLDELARGIRTPRLVPVHNDGLTLPGVPDESIGYVFSFGVFVHLDREIRLSYLAEIHRVLTDDGVAVVQYGEKRKPEAADNTGFADNTGPDMRRDLIEAGFFILEENLTLLPHSNVIVFRRNSADQRQTLPDA